jgi:putative transposase
LILKSREAQSCNLSPLKQGDTLLKRNILKLVKWFCRRLTYNELSSAIIIFHEVLCKSRSDIELKPDAKPPHYRNFRVDMIRPLTEPPKELEVISNWENLKIAYQKKTGKELTIVHRRKKSILPPSDCTCGHCKAPARYLYINDGKKANQVLCKICNQLSPTHRIRLNSKSKYFCPHCTNALYLWKQNSITSIYKCQNNHCSHYLTNLKALTKEEHLIRDSGNTSQFKLRYQYREYHFKIQDLQCARPAFSTKTDLYRIHNNSHVVSMALTYFINIGLSSRQTKEALLRIHNIKISHQTIINYANSTASLICSFVDKNSPKPKDTVAGDETYIIVENRMQYTWFNIEGSSKAICGFNLSGTRGTAPCLALQLNTYGPPEDDPGKVFEYVADGLPSYDSAIMAYNKDLQNDKIIRHKVVGLENLDPESKEYRKYKQIVERLNRTYKFHTRPRAGFKTFKGAVCLTVLFVAFYNFMRPHSSLKGSVPVQLACLNNIQLYPQMWSTILQQAA